LAPRTWAMSRATEGFSVMTTMLIRRASLRDPAVSDGDGYSGRTLD
jgi:hypothetical protein